MKTASITLNKKRGNKKNMWLYVVVIVLSLVYLLPLYVLFNMSLRSIDDLSSRLIMPQVLNLGNYIAVLRDSAVWIGFKNSIFLVAITVVVELTVSALGAYGIARSNTRLTSYIRQCSMAVMMIPSVALLVGTYSLMIKMGMVNSLTGLGFLLAAGGIPGCMFMYTNFIISIPTSLDEAAMIDGANILQTFFKVIMPQLKAITVTRLIIVATGCWNQYLMPLYLLQEKPKHTIVLIIKSAFSSINGVSNIPRACATCVIGVLPIIVLYLFLQRFIIEGQLDSSTK